ncbi:MAG TPA: nitroreductase family protein [Acidobacteriota bacterium]|nr:nitroreductase family protein [Acidobacteriota bacterium]
MIQGKAVRRYRQPDKEIESLLVERWSPRSFSGRPVSQDDLTTLFEAARWAPSCYNEQPWRFLYAHRQSPHWERFFSLLAEGNQAWCAKAGVLLVLLSSRRFERNDKPNASHSLDAGSAWQNLALQATRMGLAAHAMAGFDKDKAVEELGVPEDFQVECMIAVGHPAPAEELPEKLREREKPSGRKAVSEFVREGNFDF